MNEIEKRVENSFLIASKGVSLSFVWIMAALGLFRYGYGFMLENYGVFAALFLLSIGITFLVYLGGWIYRVFKSLTKGNM